MTPEQELLIAETWTADEIVAANLHFESSKAYLISMNKVAKRGADQCRKVIASLEADEKKQSWWKFW